MRNILFAILFCLLFCVSVFAQEAQKIDEFGFIQCDDYLARMDNVMNQAHINPNAKIYVFVYEGKTLKYNHKVNGNYKTISVLPQYGLAKVRIDSMKKYISKVRKYSLKQFEFVKAGLREDFTVEFWTVSIGAKPPESTPTLTKIKYRKGKSAGFCLGCCY